MNIYNIEKVSDGFLVYGDYKGTLNVTGSPAATGRDIYLIKYNNSFEFQWVEKIGGTLIDFAYDLKVADDGSIYLLGTFKGTCLFEGANTITADGLLYDVMIAKYTSDGTFVWGKQVAQNDADQYGTSIDIDTNGDLIVAGYYTDSITFNNNDRHTEAYGLFYAKVNNSGNVLWSKSISSTENGSRLTSLSAFDDGYYFNGRIKGTLGFDLGDETANNPSFTDIFIYKTNFSGNGLWVRRSYGDGNALTGTITDDEYGNIYLTGYYAGTQMEIDEDETSKSSTVLGNNGSLDIFVASYNKQGNLNWFNNYGENGEDFARDIKFQNDFLYITGYFSGSITFGNDILTSGDVSDLDAFLGMIDKDGNTLKAIKVDDSDGLSDSGMELSSDNANNAYWGGYFKSTAITIGDSTFTNPNPGKSCVFVSKYKPPYVAAFTKKTEVSCIGGSDGELIVTPYFGVLPYTYTWDHDIFLNDSTASSLTAGTYEVTITDALDSTVVEQYTITEPDPFIFNPSITNVSTCSYSTEGALDITVTGGNGGYTYEWTQSDGGSGVVLADEDQTGLTIGSYNVKVTDSKACFNDTTILITGPSPVEFSNSIVTPFTGFDPVNTGAIDLELTGGTGTPSAFSTSWTGPNSYTASTQDISGLEPGEYIATVIDDNLCSFKDTLEIINQDELYAYISSSKKACKGLNDGKATVSYYSPKPDPDITYLWNDPAAQTTSEAINLAPGRYYVVTVTDNNPPTEVSKDSVYIDELTYDFTGSISGTTDLDCKGDADGFIDLTITSAGITPYSYVWSNGPTTPSISDLTAGTYNITVKDANECAFTTSDHIINEPALDLSAIASITSEPLCYSALNGSVKVDVVGGTANYTYIWDDPGNQTSQEITGLEADNYRVVVTDANGCQTADNIILTQPDLLSITNVTPTDVSCNSLGDGQIAITTTGGSGLIEYSITGGSSYIDNGGLFTNLLPSKYIISIRDANLCEANGYESWINEPDTIELLAQIPFDISCNGLTDGSITLAAIGGTGTLEYSIDEGTTYQAETGVFLNQGAGTNYIVKVKDANNCLITGDTLSLIDPSAISINSEETTDISCNGFSDGEISLTANGGTGKLHYSIDNGSNFQTNNGNFISLDPVNNYQVVIKDDNNCIKNGSLLEITEPTEILITDFATTDISCYGLTDGIVSVTAEGGTGNFEYSTDGTIFLDNSGLFTGLTKGLHQFYVREKDNIVCKTTGNITVNEPDTILITSEQTLDITCNGLTDGSITIVAAGGTGTLDYSINNGSSYQSGNETFTDLASATDYAIKVKDANNCTVSGNILTINNPSAIAIDSEEAVNISCNGLTDGLITLTASGGTGSLQYSIDNGANFQVNESFPNLTAANNYEVVIKDANDCQVSGSTIEITEPAIIAITNFIKTNASCYGLTDGTLSITAEGGTGNLTYSIDNGLTYIDNSGDFSDLAQGDYQLAVKDDNNCEFSGNIISIIEPEQF